MCVCDSRVLNHANLAGLAGREATFFDALTVAHMNIHALGGGGLPSGAQAEYAIWRPRGHAD